MGVKQKAAFRRPRNILSGSVLIGLLVAGLLLFGPLPDALAAPPPMFPEHRGKIALDPGHGGNDLGGRGPSGTLEKEICLAFVRRLAAEMEPDYQIVLTRSDDYDVVLPDRAALANNQDADLLISIHTGAGFLHATTGITLYAFRPGNKDATGNTPFQANAEGTASWDRAQMPYSAASSALAETLMQTLSEVPGAPDVRIVQAPLAVLKSAQMPAVLIEIGYLTNPAAEESLNTGGRQTAYARAIARGIDIYLAAVRRGRNPE